MKYFVCGAQISFDKMEDEHFFVYEQHFPWLFFKILKRYCTMNKEKVYLFSTNNSLLPLQKDIF